MYSSIFVTWWSSLDEAVTLYERPLIDVPSPGFTQNNVGSVPSDESGRRDSMTLQRVIGLVQAETREVRPGRRSAGG
jgi:hypothetical protein